MLELVCSKKEDGILVIGLKGELNSTSCNSFNNDIRRINDGEPCNIVLDFSNLTYLSSAGLRSLILIFKSLSTSNKKLIILNPSSLVNEVLRVSGFVKLIPICKTFEEVKDLIK
ncbi:MULTISPECIES: STAS domain-containing protein [unclassified Francisella]|uniref:STAS domain-containing protein n=1 Tax=unclassified Francisella TaxID=2610885 RepID=UPI002E32E4B6|nr:MULTISPECIES: STAS domain-containing protein [unclassified Francisella]MED7818399.1 STAS domain-containing protein [Francisella sp. 19S2-4]MED7829235.1 STAS domain-containing protein [Francisella sp. 19S2-10]